jgi:hypothetical protein
MASTEKICRETMPSNFVAHHNSVIGEKTDRCQRRKVVFWSTQIRWTGSHILRGYDGVRIRQISLTPGSETRSTEHMRILVASLRFTDNAPHQRNLNALTQLLLNRKTAANALYKSAILSL